MKKKRNTNYRKSNNRIKPAGGLRMLGTLIEHTGSITRVFGF